MFAARKCLSKAKAQQRLLRSSRCFSTAFDGDMARLYLNFFNQAETAWKKTNEIVVDSTAGENISEIIDVASGPGEPGLTLAGTFPNANVHITDGAEAMLALAEERIAKHGVGDRVTTTTMSLNDFSPLENINADLVTAQFALMFTEDLPSCLSEIRSSLRDDGFLIGTVWEEFFILPLLRDTMTTVLGETPPAPPINPLSLKDRDLLDSALAAAGFETFGRHNETATITIDIGKFDEDDTIKTVLIPVTPTLVQLQEDGNHGGDVFGTAKRAMRDAIQKHNMINAHGNVEIPSSTYRYFVARKR